jgi:hypothetical protein
MFKNNNFILMKTTLLFIFGCIASQLYSQTPINSFYGANNSSFSLLTSATTLDHSATGANQNWNFNQLIGLGTSLKTNTSPTSTESTTFPGTTTVINSTYTEGTTITTGKLLTRDTAGVVSITGLDSSGILANFVTNNATIGTFPMNYGYTNTDSNVAGNYTYTTYSGTFTGSLITTVDAYGTLALNNTGTFGPYSGNVTRVKNVLTLSLNYSIFSNVGTVTQTTYSYYDANDGTGNPIFRSIVTAAVVPLLSINQTETTLERFNVVLLGVNNPKLESVWIKNPVTDQIEINTDTRIENATIRINDMLGKTIYQVTNQSINGNVQIPFSLTKGMYLITIETENRSITKKIIKN